MDKRLKEDALLKDRKTRLEIHPSEATWVGLKWVAIKNNPYTQILSLVGVSVGDLRRLVGKSILAMDVEDEMYWCNYKMLVTVLATLVINIHYHFTSA